jgi:hypothetical protein
MSIFPTVILQDFYREVSSISKSEMSQYVFTKDQLFCIKSYYFYTFILKRCKKSLIFNKNYDIVYLQKIINKKNIMFKTNIVDLVKDLRKETNVSQEELANYI